MKYMRGDMLGYEAIWNKGTRFSRLNKHIYQD